MVGVVGGCGGVGASRFASALAATAAERDGRALLVDLDPAGGGLDVLLGAESTPGARWSGLRLAGGALDAQLLLSGLPAWGRAAVLACDRVDLPPPDDVAQVLRAVRGAAPVVLDLSRHPSDARRAAIACCTLVLVVCACDLAALTAARSVIASLAQGESVAAPVGLVVRGGRAAAARATNLIDAPIAARLAEPRGRDGAALVPASIPRRMRRVARGLLAGLPDVGALEPPAARAASLTSVGWMPPLDTR